MASLAGIHHVTAITADAQRNLDFYCGTLGLRFVKKTVNFDDPNAYHLYYGDELGRPGTLMTFFVWPGAVFGRQGAGQVTATCFTVPSGSVDFWAERLEAHDTPVEGRGRRFGEEVLTFRDPDGLLLELAGTDSVAGVEPWSQGPVPPEHAVRGLFGVTLTVTGFERSARLLTETMGFEATGKEGDRYRFRASSGPARVVDLLSLPDAPSGLVSAGTVHHVAFRTPDPEEQLGWRQALSTAGLDVTPVLDRVYFRSIYFREPAGVLFEIATDGPGFTFDEAPEELGSHLRLPPWLEPRRPEFELRLPPIRVAGAGRDKW